jgi:hypothetical protein
MSDTPPTPTPSSFEKIFDDALEAYKERTNYNLLTHPFAERLKDSDSASSIRTVLKGLVQEFDKSQRNRTKWLDPTVNALLVFSDTLGAGVGLVCFRK